jgi:hypothetical protein
VGTFRHLLETFGLAADPVWPTGAEIQTQVERVRADATKPAGHMNASDILSAMIVVKLERSSRRLERWTVVLIVVTLVLLAATVLLIVIDLLRLCRGG